MGDRTSFHSRASAHGARLGALAAAIGRTACTLLCFALASGCERQRAPHESFAHLDIGSGAAEQAYLAPPRVVNAVIGADGAIAISGRAAAAAQVTFSTPEGETFHTTSDAQGNWTARLPQAGLPRLFAISSQQAHGRAVHAEGALVTVPHAVSPAVLVRAGYPAQPFGMVRSPDIVSLDYDPGGFAGVSGFAPARSTVRLTVDGLPAGVAQADAQGRFAILAANANRRPGFGPHEVEAVTAAGVVRRTVMLSPPAPLAGAYVATGAPGSWTVEWALNGGGVQTTLLLAPPRS
jgi:hypothetical protein